MYKTNQSCLQCGSFSEAVYQLCDIGTKKSKCFKAPNMQVSLMFITYHMWETVGEKKKKDNLYYLRKTKEGSNDVYCQELTVENKITKIQHLLHTNDIFRVFYMSFAMVTAMLPT